jgi:hypothetical protein
MNKCNAMGVVAIFATTLAWAGPDVIIRERAKQLRDQNNARQGVPPPSQPAPAAPSTKPTPAAPSNITAAPATPPGLARLQVNLAAIKTNSVVSADQRQRLAQDLSATAQGTKLSPALANKLAADLAAAFAEKPLSATDRSRIAQNLNAVLNPGNIPSGQMDEIVADVQSVLQKRGVSATTAGAIAADLKAVLAESRKTAGR